MSKNASPSHRSEYFRSAVGAILYLANITRPDLAFYASFLGAHVANPKPDHLDMLKGLLKYIQDTKEYGIFYSYNSTFSTDLSYEDQLHLYTDSDFAAEEVHRHHRSGIVITFMGSAVNRISRKQSSVATSTTHAELFATVNGI